MMASFLSRSLMLIFGYAYPAYKCFKTVEKNKPDIGQLVFWCQYWILIAMLTISERVADAFISWLPLYGEAKLAFFIYLWYPKTKGTTYLYNSFLRPCLVKHEAEIDHTLLELRIKAREIAVVYWQRAADYGQTRIFAILQYVSLQSVATHPHPAQQQQSAGDHQTLASFLTHQQSATTENDLKQSPISGTSSVSLHRKQHVPAQIADQLETPGVSLLDISAAEANKKSTSSKLEAVQVEDASSSENANANSPQKVTVIEGAIRVTRDKLRKIRGSTNL